MSLPQGQRMMGFVGMQPLDQAPMPAISLQDTPKIDCFRTTKFSGEKSVSSSILPCGLCGTYQLGINKHVYQLIDVDH
jgi:hypothetical protein